MATVEKHAPRNYVAFKNIKICQRFQRFRKISKSSKNKKNFKERFEVFRAKQKSLRVHFSRGGSELFRQKSTKEYSELSLRGASGIGCLEIHAKEDFRRRKVKYSTKSL